MKGWTRENFTFLIITFLSNNQKWNFLSRPILIIRLHYPHKDVYIVEPLSIFIDILGIYNRFDIASDSDILIHPEIIVSLSYHKMFSPLYVFVDHS